MSNGYGSSSSSSRSTTNAEGQIAPPGFHYMPDGTLMSDLEHERLFSVDKIIRSFDMNLNHLPSASKKRIFDDNFRTRQARIDELKHKRDGLDDN